MHNVAHVAQPFSPGSGVTRPQRRMAGNEEVIVTDHQEIHQEIVYLVFASGSRTRSEVSILEIKVFNQLADFSMPYA